MIARCCADERSCHVVPLLLHRGRLPAASSVLKCPELRGATAHPNCSQVTKGVSFRAALLLHTESVCTLRCISHVFFKYARPQLNEMAGMFNGRGHGCLKQGVARAFRQPHEIDGSAVRQSWYKESTTHSLEGIP